jgi:hypothetical protein
MRRGESYAAELEYGDSRETRLFDLGRYRKSLLLPEIIKSLDRRKCYHGRDANFFSIELSDSEEYLIFFKPSKSRGNCKLYVQSAYVAGGIPKPKIRKPIKFSVIVYNTMTGRPIRRP